MLEGVVDDLGLDLCQTSCFLQCRTRWLERSSWGESCLAGGWMLDLRCQQLAVPKQTSLVYTTMRAQSQEQIWMICSLKGSKEEQRPSGKEMEYSESKLKWKLTAHWAGKPVEAFYLNKTESLQSCPGTVTYLLPNTWLFNILYTMPQCFDYGDLWLWLLLSDLLRMLPLKHTTAICSLWSNALSACLLHWFTLIYKTLLGYSPLYLSQ